MSYVDIHIHIEGHAAYGIIQKRVQKELVGFLINLTCDGSEEVIPNKGGIFGTLAILVSVVLKQHELAELFHISLGAIFCIVTIRQCNDKALSDQGNVP